MDDENSGRKKSANLLNDGRFKAMFTNPEFEVDKNAEEYKMLTPVLSRLQKGKVKELKRKVVEGVMPFMDEEEKVKSDDDDLFSEKAEDTDVETSDDDDVTWQKELKKTYRQIRKDQKTKSLEDDDGGNSTENENDGEPTTTTYGQSNSSNGNSKHIEFKVKNITTKTNK